MSNKVTGHRGVRLIKSFESLRLQAYRDQGGVWTIGWGHTRGVAPGMFCSKAQADAWFLEDIADAERDVNSMVKIGISQSMFDALVSFTYNLGGHNFEISTLRDRVNAKMWREASEEFQKWSNVRVNGVLTWSRGLARRRHRESALFLEDRFPD